MKICAIDFESTGVKPLEDRVTEIGAVFFDGKTFVVTETFSALVHTPGQKLSDEVIAVTGITDALLKKEGVPLVDAVLGLMNMLVRAGWPDVFMAHNKSFDQNIFASELQRLVEAKLMPETAAEKFLAVPWVCSIADIKHPEKMRSKKLSHLALDYGVAVDPAVLHRATDDCKLLVKMLQAANVNFSALLVRSKVPDVIVRAVVPSPFGAGNDGGRGKDKAKSVGFGWQRAPGTDGPEFKNCWVKKVKESEIPELKKELGYEVTIVS